MIRMPSIGLIEIIILAIVAGLALLAGGLVLVLVARKQRGHRTQVADQPGPDTATSRSPKLGTWLLLLSLVAVLALPLVVIAGGILIITPVRSSRSDYQGPTPEMHVVAMSTPNMTSMAAMPINTTQPTSEPGTGLVDTPPSEPASLSISPDDDMLFVTLPSIAGLTILVGAAILAVIRTRWQSSDAWSKEASEASGGKRSKWGVALVAFGVLAALSIFTILALDFSIWFFGWSVIIFAACSILVGLLLLVPRLVRRWKGTDTQPRDQRMGDDNGDEWAKTARLRYALLALAIWFALSIFLVLDVGFSVSVYLQFTTIYTAFWVLVGALLLVGSPRREKLLILGLLVIFLFSIRFVDWNSRKPFLKDFYRVREGMTVEQVEHIMGNYIGGTCYPAHPLGLPAGKSAAEAEELALPDRAVYRHTDEGWGDSDWGEITFEKGRVVQTQFLPD
jgi:hypothetical protein